jgi:hypothetical protein
MVQSADTKQVEDDPLYDHPLQTHDNDKVGGDDADLCSAPTDYMVGRIMEQQ